jgi:hypothetical protein
MKKTGNKTKAKKRTKIKKFILRPSIINPDLWFPERNKSEWNRIRKSVLLRDDYTCQGCGHRALKWMHVHHVEDSANDDPANLVTLCVACHHVMHIGRSLMDERVEIWECDLSQAEIVRQTREGVRRGLSFEEIKKKFKLRPGKYEPTSLDCANTLIEEMGDDPRAYLPELLRAIFIRGSRWQLE